MRWLMVGLAGVLWVSPVGAECRVVGVLEGVGEGVFYVREKGLDGFYYEVKVGEELEKVVKEIRGSVQVVIVMDDMDCSVPVVMGGKELGKVVSVEVK